MNDCYPDLMCHLAPSPSISTHHGATGCHGFSLLELTVSMVLIGVLLGFGLSFVTSEERENNIAFTQERLAEIEEAIRRFVRLENRLPCPADPQAAENSGDFGVEDDCSAAAPTAGAIIEMNNGSTDETWAGVLPVRTLGLPDRYMTDAWSHRLTYITPRRFAATGVDLVNTNAENTATMIRIQEKTQSQTINPMASINNPVMYLVISHGPDKRGAYSLRGTISVDCADADIQLDAENCDFLNPGDEDVVFIDDAITSSRVNAQYFHDMLLWKTKVTLGAVHIN
ncbi:MAG: type II secretion system protein [Sphaerospermopsis sp. SIO1G2]|nr:type II secretion system protein [Sphaerospermopsis sp. SIO1G2]